MPYPRSARYVKLTRWSATNFKSIGHAGIDLREGHVSVLTGTNSVGKSSLLQSIRHP